MTLVPKGPRVLGSGFYCMAFGPRRSYKFDRFARVNFWAEILDLTLQMTFFCRFMLVFMNRILFSKFQSNSSSCGLAINLEWNLHNLTVDKRALRKNTRELLPVLKFKRRN